MRGRYSIEEALAQLAISVDSREELKRACEYCKCRLQVERVNGRNIYYLQSTGVSILEGGKIWRVP
eukprot:8360557-Karenia_brevis.AAC.1